MSGPGDGMHLRAWDLLRQMRNELVDQRLISLEEFAWLAADSPAADPRPNMGSVAPRRLETYDEHEARMEATIAKRAACEELALERIAAVFYVLMRDDPAGITPALANLASAVNDHGRKVTGRADFTNKPLAHEARRLARRLLVDSQPVILKTT